MAEKSITRPEIYPLTGVRAIAALWVVLYHLRGPIAESYPRIAHLAEPFLAQGYLGVDLFFILSGFIIYYNYAERMRPFRPATYLEFLWLRLARLWPVHFVMMLLFAIAITIGYRTGHPPVLPELYTASKFIQNLLLVHCWKIPADVSWNVPSWSISCEWLAYLLFPLLIFSRLPTASPKSSLWLAAAAFLVEGAICQWLQIEGNAQYGIIRILGAFTAGAALSRLYQTNAGRNLPWEIVTPLAGGAVVVSSFWLLPALALTPFWCLSFLGLIVFGLACHHCATARLLSTKPFLLGGYISYSLYMVHELSYVALIRLKIASPVLHLVAAILAGALMYYLIEEPCRKVMRRFYSRLKPHGKEYPA